MLNEQNRTIWMFTGFASGVFAGFGLGILFLALFGVFG